MRRQQVVKEDDPFMASRCQHAQSKLVCINEKKQVNVAVTLYIFVVLIVFIVSGK
jgi:hypothetical protein